MPKPRIIDANFWNDPDVASLTRDERLLLAAMITTCADDYGRMMAHAPYLRKQAFGYDDDISVDDVQAMRDNIVQKCRNVILYHVDGQEYIWLRKYQKHQKIRYQVKSTLPEPLTESEPLQEIPANSGNLPLGSVVLGSVEKGSVEVDAGSVDTMATAAVFNAWAKARGGAINSMDADQVGDLIDEFTTEWVQAAIEEANQSRQDRLPSLNFVRAILDRWKREGFKKPFDWRQKREEAQAEAAAKEEQDALQRKLDAYHARWKKESH